MTGTVWSREVSYELLLGGAQRMELESVKRERRTLLASLAALKNDQGKGGSELQQEDIGRLRSELEAKKEKVNELKLVGALARLHQSGR